MKLSVYREMIHTIYHTINMIKRIRLPEISEEQKVPFKFKKEGFNKLIIFDLDETLIHCKREEYYEEIDYGETIFEPSESVNVTSPEGETVATGFSIRPFALECLKKANEKYEVAIFTAGHDWYANPIIDYLDKDGTLVQHRFFRSHTTKIE